MLLFVSFQSEGFPFETKPHKGTKKDSKEIFPSKLNNRIVEKRYMENASILDSNSVFSTNPAIPNSKWRRMQRIPTREYKLDSDVKVKGNNSKNLTTGSTENTISNHSVSKHGIAGAENDFSFFYKMVKGGSKHGDQLVGKNQFANIPGFRQWRGNSSLTEVKNPSNIKNDSLRKQDKELLTFFRRRKRISPGQK